LFFNRARYYDAGLGRYVTPDPLGLEGGDLSLYTYANSAPTKYTDPDGLQAIPIPGPVPIPALPPWMLPVAGAGWAGWEVGNLINPYVQPAIGKAIDWCMSSSGKQRCLDDCYAAYLNQVSICKMAPTPKARAQCYSRASDLHGQCRAGCK
jgi:hypothetical protein